jgi:hypothetical protein
VEEIRDREEHTGDVVEMKSKHKMVLACGCGMCLFFIGVSSEMLGNWIIPLLFIVYLTLIFTVGAKEEEDVKAKTKHG